MTFFLSFLILLCQFLIGYGLLVRCKFVDESPKLLTAGLSLILGMGISCFGVFLEELMRIPLTLTSILAVNLVLVIVALFPFGSTIEALTKFFASPFKGVKPYGFVTLCIVLFFMFISGWLAYYSPVLSVDAIAGPDLVAKYAVEQGTMASSVFYDLEGNLSNQPFYAPFITIMQIQFRLAGNPFGQVWIPIMALAFIAVLYSKMRSQTHGAIAGILTVLFIMIPEMFFYTTSLLTDYSNAVFFGCSVMIVMDYVRTKENKYLIVASILMGFACFTRIDSIVLAGLGILSTGLYMISKKEEPFPLPKALLSMSGMFLVSFLFFFLWNILYISAYLPVKPTAEEQLYVTLFDFGKVMKNIGEINEKLVFDTIYFAYTIPIFFVWVLINAAIRRSFQPLLLLLWIVSIYVGFVIILGLFPAAVIDWTIKRGFFKFFALFYLFIASSNLSKWLDAKITSWEAR